MLARYDIRYETLLARKKEGEKCFDLQCRFHSVGRAARWNKARMWKEMYKSILCTLGMVPECGEFFGEDYANTAYTGFGIFIFAASLWDILFNIALHCLLLYYVFVRFLMWHATAKGKFILISVLLQMNYLFLIRQKYRLYRKYFVSKISNFNLLVDNIYLHYINT